MSDYEWRIYRQTGLTPSQAHDRGIGLAAARGHRPIRTPSGEVLREHQIRDIRRVERGLPTEAERRYLRRQWQRLGEEMSPWDEYDDMVAAFMAFPADERDQIRTHSEIAARRYRQSHSRFRWDTDAPASFGAFPTLGADRAYLMFYH